MRILLLCMSGITTSVLAKKLQTHSDLEQLQDTFIACKVGAHMDYLSQVDVVLLAPQAKYCLPSLEPDIKTFHIPMVVLGEEDLVFSKVESIYARLETYRNITRQQLEVVVENKTKRLFLREYLIVLENAIVRCIPFLLLGIASYGIVQIWQVSMFEILAQISLNLFGLYLLFSVGYCYGVQKQLKPLPYAFITIAAPLVMTPLRDIGNYVSAFVRVSEGYISTKAFDIQNCLFLFLLSILAIFILDQMQSLLSHRNKQYRTIVSDLLEMPLKYGMVFIFFLFARMLLYSFL